VVVPGLIIYILFSTLFGFFFVFADEIKHELGQASDIVIDLSKRSDSTIRIGSSVPDLPSLASRATARILVGLLEVGALGLGLCVAWAYHRPLTAYFRARRRGQTVSETVVSAAKARIWYSPPIMALAGALPILAELGLRLILEGFSASEAFMLPMKLAILALSALFTYLWQRHRIQERFVPLLFSREELAFTLPEGHALPVRKNFLVVITLATILPVSLVALFLGSGISFVGPLSSLPQDQRQLLFGEGGSPLPAIDVEGLGSRHASGLRLDHTPIPVIRPFDTLRIVTGLLFGLSIVLVYVILIARWTAEDISRPLEKLRANMSRAEIGDLSAMTPATTANEIGELTIGFNAMLKGMAERGRIKELFGQYLTKEISEAILEGRVTLDGARYEATVMFTDIRGFTAMSEKLSPEEVFAFLNDYLGRMIEVIAARGGIIDKFLGDGILAVFGLPVVSTSHADNAFAAAMDMRGALAALNAERGSAGKEKIRIGIGMHTGEVIAGNVGSSKKLQFTVIGDTVNVASRIESLNKDFGSYLLLTGSTYAKLGDEGRRAPFVRIEGASLRGKAEKLDLYRLQADE